MSLDENYEVYQGCSLTIKPIYLKDADGNKITGADSYTGTEPLETTIWPGMNQPAAFIAASTTWLTFAPSDNTIAVHISDEQTASVSLGKYKLLTRLTDADDIDPAYACWVVVLPFAGGRV